MSRLAEIVSQVRRGRFDRRTLFEATGIAAAGALLNPDLAFGFERIAYVNEAGVVDLAEVVKIHGTADPFLAVSENWGFIPGNEFGFAARFREKPGRKDSNARLDPFTVGEGYRLLAEPDLPSGFREERIVAGPGQEWVRAHSLLMRRDRLVDDVRKFILEKRTTDTVTENREKGTDLTVIGVNGLRGKGDINDPIGPLPIPFLSLKQVAEFYGGKESDYEWVPGKEGEEKFAARLKEEAVQERKGHRLVFLNPATVLEIDRLLWSEKSTQEERAVVGPGQNGIYVRHCNFRMFARPDVGYKIVLKTKIDRQNAENRRDTTDIQVVGINGFRGGEK